MMRKYARIDAGIVVEFLDTDGDISQMFHPDLVWSDITEITPLPSGGWSASQTGEDWVFSAPVAAQPSEHELKIVAMERRDLLLKSANEATAGMADAYIAGLLNDEDVMMFKAYAVYKLALNKIETQENYPSEISWPELPD